MLPLYFLAILSLQRVVLAASNPSASLTGTSITTAFGTFNLTTTAACACLDLYGLYPTGLLFPNSTNYVTVNTEVWDKRSNLDPACIFVPTTADEVANGVGILNSCDAQFAIRGGGHMNFPGANNIDGGVLLALSGLHDIAIAADNSTVEVGPGLRWFDVYSYLEPYGRIVIGGRLKTIGVPGLTLIGGVHYFNNKYGFAMDNVVSYDVVLGNGTQVTATATTNRDLFWALKGGANNFGLVTKFTLKTHAIPKVSTTIQQFNESTVEPFLKAVCDLSIADDATIAAGAVLDISYNATTKVVTPLLLGVQEGTESPASRFGNFSAIPTETRVNNVSTLAQWAANLDSPLQMFRISFGQHTMRPDAEQLFAMYKIWKDAVDQIADVDGLVPTFVVNIDPTSARTIAKTNGVGNTWGLDDSEAYIWWELSTGWNLPQDDLRMTTWSRQVTEHLHSLNQAKGLSTEFVYMGDAAEWQDPFVGFAEGNVEKMKTIRTKYDVDGVFTRLNWGGFKLGY